MRRWGWALLAMALTGCMNVSLHTGDSDKKPSPSEKRTPTPEVHSVVTDSTLAPSINAFAFDVYRTLATQTGNLVISPLSISTLLASLVPGAVGSTQAEMLRVLHLGTPDANYLALNEGLDLRARAAGASWSRASRAWVQSGYPLLPAYVAKLREGFRYDLGSANFRDSTETVRLKINGWVAQQTQDRIHDLFPPGTIDAGARLVLVNAVYFKGQWLSSFDKTRTTPAPFHQTARQSISVPMMTQMKSFRLGRIAKARVLELPYEGEQLAMLVILPDAIEGLRELEQRLSSDSLVAWSAGLAPGEVAVRLPCFTSSQHFELNDALAKMGMPTAFDLSLADFSGITGARDLYLSQVMHGAFIDVNEEGTEAAAASGAVMRLRGVARPEEFTADHPFLYLIRDRATGTILFMGRVVDPRG